MRYLLLTLCLSFSLIGLAQPLDSVLQHYQFTADRIIDPGGESINYLLSQTQSEEPLPLILFCQGSLPRPLLIQTPQGVAGVFPFNHYGYRNQYRFAIVSQPGVPLMPAPEDLNTRYSYAPGGQFPEAYRRQNTLPAISERTLQVLNHLAQQPWCNGKVILIGHSQGARIAAEVASQAETVSKVVYLSASPFPRQWQVLLSARESHEPDSLAQTKIEELQAYYASIFTSPEDSLDGNQRSERSFSVSQLETLLALDRPLFVGYGTADVGTWFCDFLPLEFARAGKTHLTLRPYPGWEHNFYETNAAGEVDYQSFHWDDVFREVMEWIER